MIDNAAVTFSNAADARAILLRPFRDMVYDIWVVHYSFARLGAEADNSRFQVALSVRARDQVDDDTGLVDVEIYEDKGLFFPWSWIVQQPTDVGIAPDAPTYTIVLAKPITVAHLAGVIQETLTISGRIKIEVHFEQRRSPDEATFLAHRARTLG